jgi:carbon monoxide dehydrogenase subunit G
MHLEGQFTAPAPQADVYAFLTDPAKVSRYMPDVKDVVIEDADHFTVNARVGISHIKGSMVMKLEIRDRQPPTSTTVIGKGTGLGSVVDMVTSFTLSSDPMAGPRLDETAPAAGPAPRTNQTVEPGPRTTVRWQGDVTISGKLAAFGPQGLLDRIARKNIDTFIDGIRAGLAESQGTRLEKP